MTKNTSLPLLNAAVAFVVLIPVLLLALALKRGGEATAPPPPPDQPPIIVLRESEGYSFPSGSAELSAAFQDKLRTTIIFSLQASMANYKCDIIEVIGHTDSQRVAGTSNLDAHMLPALNGRSVVLSAGSNVDLGLLRAWSVIQFLRQEHQWPTKVRLYAYSAGQAIHPDGTIVREDASTIDANRRRIELRVRRSPYKRP